VRRRRGQITLRRAGRLDIDGTDFRVWRQSMIADHIDLVGSAHGNDIGFVLSGHWRESRALHRVECLFR